MKQYLRYFRWVFIVIGVLIVFYIGLLAVHSFSGGAERTNADCLTEERVFDYADVLTDEEEEDLRGLIAKREAQTQSDIVLLILNESLEEYALSIDPSAYGSDYVQIYAENYYDENLFGYNKPKGDGVLLVDNWFREADGSVYTWLCTTGNVKSAYSIDMSDHLLDQVYLDIESNPYKAYKSYINNFYHDMTGTGMFSFIIPGWVAFAAGIVVMLVFVVIHWNSKKGTKTVLASTYVEGGKPEIKKKEDTFINKVVTSRRIQTNNSSGGGSGGGGGGGGGSHGGSGHSR